MKELSALGEAINQLPEEYRRRLTPHMLQVGKAHSRQRRLLKLAKDALGNLRLDLKYLVFDLEATRQERDEYKAQLERK